MNMIGMESVLNKQRLLCTKPFDCSRERPSGIFWLVKIVFGPKWMNSWAEYLDWASHEVEAGLRV